MRRLAIVFVTASFGLFSLWLAPSLPPVARAINGLGCALVALGYDVQAVWLFELVAAHGDGDALNNLGLMQARGLGVAKERWRGEALIERAAAKGHVAARYNLAYLQRSDHEAPVESIRKTVALLEPNVTAGDPHSAFLLARRLYYVNRDRVVPDRAARRLELLAIAAASGDIDYRYDYADELVDQGRDTPAGPEPKEGRWSRAELLRRGLEELIAIDAAGDPRAANLIAFVLWQVVSGEPSLVTGDIAAQDHLAWRKRSADMGHMPARCALGLALYRKAGQEPPPEADRTLAGALSYLVDCAEASEPKRSAARPFASPALYAAKLGGTRSALSNSPGWANLHLGAMYAAGKGVPRDLVKARQHLRVAAEVHRFEEAKAALEQLGPSRR
jgi:TPR repeat protein